MPRRSFPAIELLNGEAYAPHPEDASLALGARFPGKTIVVVAGGGTGCGWTQRVRFDRHGKGVLEGCRSVTYRRASQEWKDHLASQGARTCGWALLLLSQQWQAAIGSSSAASLGGTGVEQMLRVREAAADFGDERIAEDAVRCAVDHPTMEGSIVVGVRRSVIEALELEVRRAGLMVAAVRVGVVCCVEQRLAELQARRQSPERTFVAYDGQSALVVGIREGAFDSSEAGLSYLVNRQPAELRRLIARRLSVSEEPKDWSDRVEVIGAPISSEPCEPREVSSERMEPVLAAISPQVRHDFRVHLVPTRTALPAWSRPLLWGTAALIMACVVGTGVQVALGARLERFIQGRRLEQAQHDSAAADAYARIERMKKEEQSAYHRAAWLDRNYHAQALVLAFLSALPAEVSVDAMSVQATEGVAQAKLRFTLLGSEEAQRSALRGIDSRLYQLGYEIARRDEPTPAPARRSGVVHSWDLVLPGYGG